MLMGLAATVVAGDPSAPILGLLVVLAPLAALLLPSRGDAAPTVLAVAAAGVAAALVLAGSILAATAVVTALGVPESRALAGGAVLVGAGLLGRRIVPLPSMAVVLGVLVLGGLVGAMAMGGGMSPWAAWSRVASQPQLVFSSTTEWVREGRTLTKATTLAFADTQRITAVSGGVVRVTSSSPGGETVREWRLSAGDSFTVRAGDRLTALAGSRLRFESGKRIPGVAESGVSWAAPRARSWALALADALGIAVTLAGGAMTLLGWPGGVSRLGAVAAPVLILACALGAVSWGVYAAWLTPDLAIGTSPLASIVAAPFASSPGHGAPGLASFIALLLAALLFAAAASWTARLDHLMAGWASRRPLARAVPALVALGGAVLAAALAARDAEAQSVLWFGLGLGASAWAAPMVVMCAAPNGAATPGVRRGTGVGVVVGGAVFAALSLALALGPAEVGMIGRHPALVAAPLAAAAAALARRHAGRVRLTRSARPSRVGCSGEGTLPQ